MTDLAQFMLPIIAFLVSIREGVIIWALKISLGIGCLAGIAAIQLYHDVVSGFQTLLSVAVGCYLVIYLVMMFRSSRQKKREEGRKRP